MHVLVAVNQTKSSEKVIKWTIANLKVQPTDRISVLTSVEPPEELGFYLAAGAAMYSPTFIEEIKQTAENSAHQYLKKVLTELKSAFGNEIHIELLVAHGHARDEIVDYCNKQVKEHADHEHLLVVGSRQLNALKRAFAGSTSDYCLHHCDCPVLVIK